MFGKVVTVTSVELSSDFEVCYGIHHDVFKKFKRHSVGFAELKFSNCAADATGTYIRSGYWIKEKGDGFKEITVFNGDLEKNDKEEFLLVLIPWANYLKTTATKIAGRFPNQAILEMHVGDTLEVSSYHDARKDVHVLMAVEAGNEMFLIKKIR